MTNVTRRERLRAATKLEIRRHARELLVREGQDAVTLRAIARELGITAPALYRYYDSREDLLAQLGEDICTDLAGELEKELDTVDGDHRAKVFTICRGFRAWSLAHPREFALVFASPFDTANALQANGDENAGQDAGRPDKLGSVFLGIAGPLMAESAAAQPPNRAPSDVRDDLAGSRQELATAFSAEGIDMPSEALSTDAVYWLLRWWIRLYGHVALEVFGRFPFHLGRAGTLFESMLSELAREVGWEV